MGKLQDRPIWLLPALLVLVLAILAGGCNIRLDFNTPAKKENSVLMPKIVVGSDSYRPFFYYDAEGKLTGIAVELGREAFHRLGYEPEFRIIDWAQKDNLLSTGEINCIWSCFTMDGRTDLYKWAGPYATSHQSVAVLHDSNIRHLADLTGKSVAVQVGTKPSELFADESLPYITRVSNIFLFSSMEDTAIALRRGHVDAIAGHEVNLISTLNMLHENYRILPEVLLDVHIGVAFDKYDESGLPEQLHQVLEDMQEDGTIERVFAQYGQRP